MFVMTKQKVAKIFLRFVCILCAAIKQNNANNYALWLKVNELQGNKKL